MVSCAPGTAVMAFSRKRFPRVTNSILAGFGNVLRLSGGITEWKAQNLPVVKK